MTYKLISYTHHECKGRQHCADVVIKRLKLQESYTGNCFIQHSVTCILQQAKSSSKVKHISQLMWSHVQSSAHR